MPRRKDFFRAKDLKTFKPQILTRFLINKFLTLLFYFYLSVIILCNPVVPSFIFAAGSPAKISLLDEHLSVHSLGMGGAYMGLVDDPSALFCNPASLSYFIAPQLDFMYAKEIVDMQLGSAGFVLPRGKSGFGVAIAHYDGGEIEINRVGEPTEELKAELNQLLSFSLARAVIPSFSLGVTAKGIRTELLGRYKDNAYALDFAGLYRTRGDRFCLGVALQNIGTPVSYRGKVKENLPLRIRAGLSGKLVDTFSHTLMLAGIVRSNPEGFSTIGCDCGVGVEYTFGDLISLRGGCKISQIDSANFRRITPTAGLGFNMGGWRCEYAWLPDENFGDSHRVSLNRQFGGGSSYKFKKGFGYFKKRMYKKAICQWEKIPSNHPDWQKGQEGIRKAKKQLQAEKYYRQGRKDLAAGKYEQARDEFGRVLGLVSDYKDTQKWQTLTLAILRGRQLEKEEKFEQAAEAYGKAFKLVPGTKVFLFELAPATKTSLFEDISGYKLAVLIAAGNKYYEAREYGRASELYQQALNLDPYNKPAKKHLAEAERAKERKFKEEEATRKLAREKAIEKFLPGTEEEVEKPAEKVAEVPVKEEPLPVHLRETLKKEKLALAVANFVGREVSLSDAWTIADFIRVELVKTGAFRVLERERMDKILGEIRFQQTGCTDRECAIEIGHLLNVQVMVVGNVAPFLAAYYVTVDVVDVKTGVIFYADRIEAKTGKELEIKTKELAQRIADKFGR